MSRTPPPTALPHTQEVASRTPARPYSRGMSWLVIALALLVIALWMLGTPGGVRGKTGAIGYAVCHQIPSRSFEIDGHSLPLCARCTGIYLGVMTAFGMFALTGRLRASRLPPLRVLVLMLTFGLLILADGVNSYLSIFAFYTPLYQPHNTLRLLTGIGAGLTMVTIVLPVFNSSLWRNPSPAQPLRSIREALLLIITAALVAVLVLIEQPVLLWIASLLSVTGVLIMFWLIGTVLFLTVTRRENTAVTWQDLTLPAVAGVAFAIAFIGGIDLVRYVLTGTWEGFTILG